MMRPASRITHNAASSLSSPKRSKSALSNSVARSVHSTHSLYSGKPRSANTNEFVLKAIGEMMKKGSMKSQSTPSLSTPATKEEAPTKGVNLSVRQQLEMLEKMKASPTPGVPGKPPVGTGLNLSAMMQTHLSNVARKEKESTYTQKPGENSSAPPAEAASSSPRFDSSLAFAQLMNKQMKINASSTVLSTPSPAPTFKVENFTVETPASGEENSGRLQFNVKGAPPGGSYGSGGGHTTANGRSRSSQRVNESGEISRGSTKNLASSAAAGFEQRPSFYGESSGSMHHSDTAADEYNSLFSRSGPSTAPLTVGPSTSSSSSPENESVVDDGRRFLELAMSYRQQMDARAYRREAEARARFQSYNNIFDALRSQQRRAKEKSTDTREVTIPDRVTVRSLSQLSGASIPAIQERLKDLGLQGVSETASVDSDTVELVLGALGIPFQWGFRRVEDRAPVALLPPPHEQLQRFGVPQRPPVVTVMGHVDHGKTTLLDCLRGTRVSHAESGGITQAVAAFGVPLDRDIVAVEDAPMKTKDAQDPRALQKLKAQALAVQNSSKSGSNSGSHSAIDIVTFIDTPGHALFTAMREAGGSATDIVVLVVDAHEGVRPQTIECVNIIRNSQLPCVVALTKIDLVGEPDEAIARVRRELEVAGLFGSGADAAADISIVPLSARTGEGVDDLKEMLAFHAELLDIRAPFRVPSELLSKSRTLEDDKKEEVSDRDISRIVKNEYLSSNGRVMGEAVVLESRMIKGQGLVVDCIVKWGSLAVGDYVIANDEVGKVRALQMDSVSERSVAHRLAEVKGNNNKKSASAGKNDSIYSLVNVQEALPGVALRLVGLTTAPPVGSFVLGMPSEKSAQAVLELRQRRRELERLQHTDRIDQLRKQEEREQYLRRKRLSNAYQLVLDRARKRSNFAPDAIPPSLRIEPWEEEVMELARRGLVRTSNFSEAEFKLHNQLGLLTQGSRNMTDITYESKRVEARLQNKLQEGEEYRPREQLKLLVFTDTAGSFTALQGAIEKLHEAQEAVELVVLSNSFTEVLEKDITAAEQRGATLVCFNAKMAPSVQKFAEKRRVPMFSGDVIYSIIDGIKNKVEDMLPDGLEYVPEAVAQVKQVFSLNANRKSQPTMAAGCVITSGPFTDKGPKYRVVRDDEIVAEVDNLRDLRILKEKAQTVLKGQECGITLDRSIGVKEGDLIQQLVPKKSRVRLNVRF